MKLDRKRLVEIKKIVEKYGYRFTASMMIMIELFLMKSSSYDKPVKQEAESDTFTISSSKVYYSSADSLGEDEMTYEEKIESILELFDLTYEELDVCCAIAVAEACCDGYDYEEAHHVINTAYNRICSEAWISSCGASLYEQMTAPGQFVVYENGSYLKYLGRDDLPGYQAVVDFLSGTSDILHHSFLSFRSNDSVVEGSTLLVEEGNRYFNLLTEEDKIENTLLEGGKAR